MPWRTGIYNDDRPETVGSTLGWVCFALGVGYVALNVFLPNNDLNIFLDAVIWVLGLYVVIKYLPRSVVTILRGHGSSADFLVVGIFLSWLSQSGRAAGSIITRLSSFDPAWLNGEYFGLVKLMTILAAVCHVISAGAIQFDDGSESLPRRSRFGLAATFFVAITMGALLISFKPDMKPWVDRMPGWTRDLFQTGSNRAPNEKHAGADPPWPVAFTFSQ